MVSVIIPNYNHGPFLRERFESVLNQTYQNFEVIILDDYSDDSSRDVIESVKTNPKISDIVYNNQNSGSPFVQWRKGIELAKGDFVWIAESDDFADVKFLAAMMKCLEGGPYVFAVCENNLVDAAGESLDNQKVETWIGGADRLSGGYNGNYLIDNYLSYVDIFPNISAFVFRNSKALRDIIDSAMHYRIAADWLIISRLMKNQEVFCLNHKLNYFRHHQQTTRMQKSKAQEILKLKEYIEVAYIIRKLTGTFQLRRQRDKFLNLLWSQYCYLTEYDDIIPKGIPLLWRVHFSVHKLKRMIMQPIFSKK